MNFNNIFQKLDLGSLLPMGLRNGVEARVTPRSKKMFDSFSKKAIKKEGNVHILKGVKKTATKGAKKALSVKNSFRLLKLKFAAAASAVSSYLLVWAKFAIKKVTGSFLYYGLVVFFGVCFAYTSHKIIYHVFRKLIKLFFATIFSFFSKLTSGSKKLTKKFGKKKKNKNSKST